MTIIKRVVFSSLFLLLIVTAGYFVGDYFHKDYMKNLEHSHPNFHKMLNLTPDQLNKLIPIEKKFSEQKALYENQIRRSSMELGDIMRKEKAYTSEVQAGVDKVHAAMGQLQKVTLVHLFDMRNLLDENQARILDEYVADAMHGL